MKVLTGIVTYNPNIERLLENVSSVYFQHCDIVIYDNGSENYYEFKNKLDAAGFVNIKYFRNEENSGIANALSEIMRISHNDYDWVLTLDQDSVADRNLINEYENAILNADEKVGMLTCLIKDRNFNDKRNEEQETRIIEVPFCITSGALMRVSAYFATDGYQVDYFIDYVDFDICYSLREKGYIIERINYIGILHEVGKAENKYLFGRMINIYNHNSKRVYTLVRNMIWTQRRHPELMSNVFVCKQIMKEQIKILFFESDKKEKMKMVMKAIKNARGRC